MVYGPRTIAEWKQFTGTATLEQWTDFLNLRRGRDKLRRKRIHLKVPFPKQQNLISYLFQPEPETVKQADLCCGRGFGKSFLSIFIATMALSLSLDEIGLFLEPDWKRVRRVFLKKWRQIVAPDLYVLNKTEQCITWLPTGSILFYGPRNITGSLEAADDSQLGQDTTFVIDDEAALRCSKTMYTNTFATIREPSNVRFYLTLSTPRVGDYKRLVTSKGHKLFRGTSFDNPYTPPGYVEGMLENMSKAQAECDVYGKFRTLKGKIWDTCDLSKAWPDGNLNTIHTDFDPEKPWYVFCDFGSSSGAYLIVQKTDPIYRGKRMFQDPLWVAVADLCPESDASASRAFQRIDAEFEGKPSGVVGGQDMNKRSDVDGNTIAYFAQQIWGSNVNIYPCDERVYNKRIQGDCFLFLCCTAVKEQRRFTVAKNFKSLDKQSKRGLLEMLEEDQWMPPEKRRVNDVYPKNPEIKVQHIRDALLMGTAEIMMPPNWMHRVDPPK